jgi:hypothetical protein
MNHGFTARKNTVAQVYAQACSGGKVLVVGRGYAFDLLEEHCMRAWKHHGAASITKMTVEPLQRLDFDSGGSIFVVNLGAGKGVSELGRIPALDYVVTAADSKEMLLQVLKTVVHPLMDRSGAHCQLVVAGE